MFINLKEYVTAINWYYLIPIKTVDRDFWGSIYYKDLESEINV